jgi:P27 family predicted phage terminase small subunit
MEGRSPGRDSGGRPIKKAPSFLRLPPEPPDWLSPEARAHWDRIVPELQRLELTKPLDQGALAAYCETWSRFVAAQMTIQVEGPFTTNANGMPAKHPAVLIVEAASKEIRAWSAEFGLTPSSEARVNAGGGGDDDDDNPFAGT